LNWHAFLVTVKTLNWGNFFVSVGIALDICAAIGYAFQGDWKRVLYWVSATGIMVAVRIM
jgi:hypothetical protein